MGLYRNLHTEQVITVPEEAYALYDAKPDWEPVESTTVGELKGATLDDALKANDLPTSGKVADKQKRLAEHLANADNTASSGAPVVPDDVTTTVPSQD